MSHDPEREAIEEERADWARSCIERGQLCQLCGETPDLDDPDFEESEWCLYCRGKWQALFAEE
jgi:hypothetical protein